MNFRLHLTAIAATLLLACNVEASVTLNISADLLQTATADTAAPTSGLVMLVANTSTTSGSFGTTAIQQGASLTVGGSIIPGDVILKEWTIGGSSGTPGAFYDTTGSLNLSTFGLAAGNPLALLWFPTLTTGASTAAASTPYGIYTGPGSTGSASWVIPSDGSTVALNMITTNGTFSTGNVAASAGVASLSVTAAPEPSRAILAALGIGFMILRRRRN